MNEKEKQTCGCFVLKINFREDSPYVLVEPSFEQMHNTVPSLRKKEQIDQAKEDSGRSKKEKVKIPQNQEVLLY